ncbi:MAG: hypothetical protein IKH51_00650, partial [Clostridia bacterium]|nr:hypothetical protein [Clostridia bacterium]
SDDICLTLNDDGTCTFYGEYTDEEDDLGKYTYIYKETGTYEKNELAVTCTMTSRNVKLKLHSDKSTQAYKDMYNEAYEDGYIARVEYEYYMELITDEGYTSEMSETYTMTLEPHTQTAVIIDSIVSNSDKIG